MTHVFSRNVLLMSVAVFLLAFGEELWSSFLPKYMEALGASVALIALFGTFKDFLDAVYQYPGGIISDRLGSRNALVAFAAMTAGGYAIYLFSTRAWMVFVGVTLVMAWSSLGSPAIFALMGEALPSEHRTIGFSLQSLLKRLPIVFAPALGGGLILRWGMLRGVRLGLGIAILMAIITLLLQRRFYVPTTPSFPTSESSGSSGFRTFQSFSRPLRRLLLSDIFARLAEGMAEIFLVLYALNVVGLNPKQFGLLIGIQMATAILGYFPAALLAARWGRKPLVAMTFLCFALFPLMVVLAKNFAQMTAAFVVGGLREFGEPARKAMIVNLVDERARGRHVGLYYLIRNIAVTPAAAWGGLLWRAISPPATFYTAFVCGLIGVALFSLAVNETPSEVPS